ncbi:MAG: hypothetical protein H0T79_05070 [Deltaproteobacteria bacterium]|nr:hypothetical protein [Deltaproteobacteria bacterium]
MSSQTGLPQLVYWHRDLPPLSEQLEGEHEVTAISDRVQFSYANQNTLWKQCHEQLMAHGEDRIRQEVQRLGGSCARVLTEEVTSQRNDATQEFWLAGRFRFVMFVHPGEPQAAA